MGDANTLFVTARDALARAQAATPAGQQVRLSAADSDAIARQVATRLDPEEAAALQRAGVTARMISIDPPRDALVSMDTRSSRLLQGRMNLQAQIARGPVGFWEQSGRNYSARANEDLVTFTLGGLSMLALGPEAAPATLVCIGISPLYSWAAGMWAATAD